MLARVRSAAVLGIDAYLVDVETDISNGLPTFATVGLPQGAVKEGRERVYAALANTGYTFPLKRITVNLAPADIRKEGSAFDLPIAVGILAATEQIAAERLARVVVLGELGLEGAIRPVRGALPVALAARSAGAEAVVLPRENLPEAGVVSFPCDDRKYDHAGERLVANAVPFLQQGRDVKAREILDRVRAALRLDNPNFAAAYALAAVPARYALERGAALVGGPAPRQDQAETTVRPQQLQRPLEEDLVGVCVAVRLEPIDAGIPREPQQLTTSAHICPPVSPVVRTDHLPRGVADDRIEPRPRSRQAVRFGERLRELQRPVKEPQLRGDLLC